MENSEELKSIVREKYAQIATQDKLVNQTSCCGSGSCSSEVYNIMTDSYEEVKGYQEEADLKLGCGLPTQFARISEGDTVIDLGSGAGNDCFVARHETGFKGKVIGVDFTPEMIAKARQNAEKLGLNNVEFRLGDIEELPVNDAIADVVVSNCVLNLVPSKEKVFAEIMRVLKPGAHFSISDIVLVGELPQALRKDAEMYAGCVSGAIQKNAYLQIIRDAGFQEVILQKEKEIRIPDDIFKKHLSEKDLDRFRSGEIGIFSITVYGEKPRLENAKTTAKTDTLPKSQCLPHSGCC